MNLTINTTAASAQSAIWSANEASSTNEAKSSSLGAPSSLTITHSEEARAGDVGKVSVSEADLAKDDALGKLVNAVFSLPAPPIPEKML